MNGAAFLRDEGGTLLPLWRFLSIVVSFFVLWPLVCGVMVLLLKDDLNARLLSWPAFYFCSGIFAFLAPSALLAGAIHAIAAVRFHYNSVLVPVVVAFGTTMLTPAQIVVIAPGQAHDLINVSVTNLLFFLVASLIASLICWRLTRRFARAA